MSTVEFSIDYHAAVEMNDWLAFLLLPPGGAFTCLFVVFSDLSAADGINILGVYGNALLGLLCGESSYLLKLAPAATGNRCEDEEGTNTQDDTRLIHILTAKKSESRLSLRCSL